MFSSWIQEFPCFYIEITHICSTASQFTAFVEHLPAEFCSEWREEDGKDAYIGSNQFPDSQIFYFTLAIKHRPAKLLASVIVQKQESVPLHKDTRNKTAY